MLSNITPHNIISTGKETLYIQNNIPLDQNSFLEEKKRQFLEPKPKSYPETNLFQGETTRLLFPVRIPEEL